MARNHRRINNLVNRESVFDSRQVIIDRKESKRTRRLSDFKRFNEIVDQLNPWSCLQTCHFALLTSLGWGISSDTASSTCMPSSWFSLPVRPDLLMKSWIWMKWDPVVVIMALFLETEVMETVEGEVQVKWSFSLADRMMSSSSTAASRSFKLGRDRMTELSSLKFSWSLQ